jgi:hypothetical protein
MGAMGHEPAPIGAEDVEIATNLWLVNAGGQEITLSEVLRAIKSLVEDGWLMEVPGDDGTVLYTKSPLA